MGTKPYIEFALKDASVIVFASDVRDLDEDNDNVDVEVTLADSCRYFATFFTLKNIQQIMRRYQESGECLEGRYFFCSHMIVVRKLNLANIRDTIVDLLDSGKFNVAFESLSEHGNGNA